jgi:acyl-CoA thioesterase-2
MRLRFSDSALYSPHADVNINGALFGGQLIGQAIAAASHGIGDRWAHSVQVSFLAPGHPGEEMHYQVRTLMQGRSFQVQQVLGTQGTRTVISATISFQTEEPRTTN